MFVRPAVSLISAFLVVAACSDSPTAPASSPPDIASLLAEMSPAGLTTAAGIVGSSADVIRRAAASPVDPNKCAYAPSSGWFVCPAVTIGEVTFTRMYRLLDGAGHSQAQPDAQTSSLQTITTMTGTLTSTIGGSSPSTSTYTFKDSSDHTLSGLRAENHTLDGVSFMTVHGSIQLATGRLTIDETQKESTSKLVLPNPQKGQRWPLSGSVLIQDWPNDSATDFSSSVLITFKGTSVVTVTITTPFGTNTCQVDLAGPPSSLAACAP